MLKIRTSVDRVDSALWFPRAAMRHLPTSKAWNLLLHKSYNLIQMGVSSISL